MKTTPFPLFLVFLIAFSGVAQSAATLGQNDSTAMNETFSDKGADIKKKPSNIRKNVTPPIRKEEKQPKELVEFKAKYGANWKVKWHSDRDSPNWIYGSKYPTKIKRIKDKNTADKIAREVIKDNEILLKAVSSELKLDRIQNDSSGWIIDYRQLYNSVPVYNGKIRVLLTNNGELNGILNNFHPNISISTTPAISEDEAVEIAKAKFTLDTLALENYTKIGNTSLIIMPQKDGGKITYRLAYEVPRQFYKFFIDANSGEIIKYYSTLMGADVRFKGTVTGNVLPHNPSDTPEPWNFKDLYVEVKEDIPLFPDSVLSENITNDDGYYDTGWMMDIGDPDIYIYAKLKGPHVFVKTSGKDDKEHRYDYGKVSGEFIHNWDWESSNETNVYYQVTRAHDYFTGPPFNYNTMTYEMKVWTDSPLVEGFFAEGAGADGTDIWIAGREPWANASNSSDVIIHEYTHNVINHIYGGNMIPEVDDNPEAWAMDEGIPDYFAGTMNNNSYMTEDLPIDRNIDNNFQYQDFGTKDFTGNGKINKYDNSLIISGVLWDLRGYAGKDVADKLIFLAFNSYSGA